MKIRNVIWESFSKKTTLFLGGKAELRRGTEENEREEYNAHWNLNIPVRNEVGSESKCGGSTTDKENRVSPEEICLGETSMFKAARTSVQGEHENSVCTRCCTKTRTDDISEYLQYHAHLFCLVTSKEVDSVAVKFKASSL